MTAPSRSATKPRTNAARAEHFTRHCIPVGADFTRDGDAFVRRDEAWWVNEARACIACKRLFVTTINGGRPPKTCSPACWIAHRRRCDTQRTKHAPFIRRGAQVTPRDLSEAGSRTATEYHLLPGVIGSLHSLACTREECVCRPVFVRETAPVEQAFEVESEYHGEVDHRLESRRLGVPAHPGRRAVPRSTEVSP